MKRLGDVAMTGAERTARWRQRRWELERDRMVAMDLEALPGGITADQARPIVEAWRARGLRHAITPAQWATTSSEQLADPELVEQLALAIDTAPPAPAPAAAVWGAVMRKVQQLWRRARELARPRTQAHAYYRHPVPAAEQPAPDSAGIQSWRELGMRLFGRAPCGCECHRDADGRRARPCCVERHRNDRR